MRRMWPRSQMSTLATRSDTRQPFVSIIVPARNEEHVLPNLLDSLQKMRYPNYEVIVVDDQSTDKTATVAEKFSRVRVISGQVRPDGVMGKQWAAHQGAVAAKGEILLFTDADTVHAVDGLAQAVRFLQTEAADMISALPCHHGEALWERLLGPFHLILLALTAPYAPPKRKKLYAIGQYLMFRREFYHRIGGHLAVGSALVEDLPLANLCIAKGGIYSVYVFGHLFGVRMYATLGDFVEGWRRNFRAGFSLARRAAGFDAFLFIAAFTGAAQIFSNPLAWLSVAGTVAFAIWRQNDLGRFSKWGPLLFPFSLIVFCYVSGLAAMDKVGKRPFRWKNRAYVQ